MSESSAGDQPRRWWRERVKRRVVRLYSAALVGGSLHARYAEQLGLPPGGIVTGYDAVDNDYFAQQTARVRESGALERARLCLPEHFFLAASRFVGKKNVSRLLQGYACYRRRADAASWSLVLLGDGELRPQVEAQVQALGLGGAVYLAGFRQYDELPVYYTLAGAFVHASTTEQWGLVVNEAMAAGLPVLVSERCGCAPDLVQDGVNGFTFDPYDVDRLADLMLKVSSDQCDREAMGQASRAIIKDWGPERFADGLMQAVAVARSRPLPRASWLDRSLIWALVHR